MKQAVQCKFLTDKGNKPDKGYHQLRGDGEGNPEGKSPN